MTASQSFEDRLLHELRLVVADRPTPTAATARRRPDRLRRPLLGLAVVAAGAAAIAVVAGTGSRTPSAYAVQPQADGAVTVRIHSLKDAAGLQRKLRAAGVPAFVDYAATPGTNGCVVGAKPPEGGAYGSVEKIQGTGAGGAGPAGTGTGTGPTTHRVSGTDGGPSLSGPGPDPGAPGQVTTRVSISPQGATFTVDPGRLKPGEKVYITTSTGAVSTIAMAVAKAKPALPCPPTP